ncbi:NAD-dependent epimerase/dehydratase family protein [Castellaniella sp.]|uniref:NAD-dependent epimerase/dehydratase family protein n=1 Tax=Castellaniella sp. TaxID=1955812 RepID=UPI003560C8AA
MSETIEGKSYLITGGASLVGSHICDVLLQAGAREIRLLDNFSLGTPATIAHLENEPRVTRIRGDVLRLVDLLEASEGVDGVFALAGFLTLPMSKDPLTGLSVNVIGMLNTLEACRFNQVRRVIFSSSIAVYGTPGGGVLDEDRGYVSCDLQPASKLYGASKLIGESLCAQYAKQYGVQFNALRFSSVYGARQHARAVNAVFVAKICDQVARGEAPVIFGDGEEVHDYVYVSDVARACMLAMVSDAHDLSINIGTGVDTTSTEVARMALRLSGKADVEPVYQADTRAVKSAAATALQIDVKRAESTIGWRADVPLEEGMRRLMEWQKANIAPAS